MQRRQFLAGSAGFLASALAPRFALANVPTPFTFDMAPPVGSREEFIKWGVEMLLQYHGIPFARAEVAFTPAAALPDHQH